MTPTETLTSTPTAQTTQLTFNGKIYQFHSLTFGDWGPLQAWVDSQFPDPMAVLREQMETGLYTVKQEQFLMKTAMELKTRPRPKIGTPEADELMGSLEGTMQIMAASLRKGDPTISDEEIRDLCASLAPRDLPDVLALPTANQ